MFNWLRELIEIRLNARERINSLRENQIQLNKVCESCETLKAQLNIANLTNQKLLDRILEKPTKEEIKEPQAPVSLPKAHIPWRIKQQMLEAESRIAAQKLKEAPQPDSVESRREIEELEKEMDLIGKERELKNANQ